MKFFKKSYPYSRHSAPITNGILHNGKGPMAPNRPASNGKLHVTFSLGLAGRTGSSQMPLHAIHSMMERRELEKAAANSGGRGARYNPRRKLPKEEHPRRRRVSDSSAATEESASENDEQSADARGHTTRARREQRGGLDQDIRRLDSDRRRRKQPSGGNSLDSDSRGRRRPTGRKGSLDSTDASVGSSESARRNRRERKESLDANSSVVSGGSTDTERRRRARQRREGRLASSETIGAGSSSHAMSSRASGRERRVSAPDLTDASSTNSGGSSHSHTKERRRRERKEERRFAASVNDLTDAFSTNSGGSSHSHTKERRRRKRKEERRFAASVNSGISSSSSRMISSRGSAPDLTDISSINSEGSTDKDKHRRARERRRKTKKKASGDGSVDSQNTEGLNKLLSRSVLSEISEGSNPSSDTIVSLEKTTQRLGDLPPEKVASQKQESSSTLDTAETSDVSDRAAPQGPSMTWEEKLELKNLRARVAEDESRPGLRTELSVRLDEKIQAKMQRLKI